MKKETLKDYILFGFFAFVLGFAFLAIAADSDDKCYKEVGNYYKCITK